MGILSQSGGEVEEGLDSRLRSGTNTDKLAALSSFQAFRWCSGELEFRLKGCLV
jgi:hypothetical protein